jgi:hypothetical protein
MLRATLQAHVEEKLRQVVDLLNWSAFSNIAAIP